MEIRTEIDRSSWESFVQNHPNGNIFQTPDMFEVFQRTKNNTPIFLAVVSENEILGLILGVIQKEFSGILGTFTSRCIVTGGPLIKDNDVETLGLLLQEFSIKVKNRVIFSQFRNLWDWSVLKDQFENFEFLYDSHLDILIDIDKNKDELWSSITSKARNRIRRANRSELVFSSFDPGHSDIDKAYEILRDVYKNAKIPLADKSLFVNAFEILGVKNQIKLFCAKKDGKIIGIRIGLLYKDSIYDWYAGSLFEHYSENPNDFLPYETMVWGFNNGFKIFDFGGAGKPNEHYGVRDHKMKFGGEIVEFGRFEKIHKPVLMKLAVMGLKIYKKIK